MTHSVQSYESHGSVECVDGATINPLELDSNSPYPWSGLALHSYRLLPNSWYSNFFFLIELQIVDRCPEQVHCVGADTES